MDAGHWMFLIAGAVSTALGIRILVRRKSMSTVWQIHSLKLMLFSLTVGPFLILLGVGLIPLN
jgi:hypothetical protein